MSTSGWIGVDLDGTLAVYHGWKDGEIGPPVPKMVARVKEWLSRGIEVRIVTARVACTGVLVGERRDGSDFAMEQEESIKSWCRQHVGVELPVTACKDFGMVELWDDRAVQVQMNTGERLS